MAVFVFDAVKRSIGIYRQQSLARRSDVEDVLSENDAADTLGTRLFSPLTLAMMVWPSNYERRETDRLQI